MTKAFFNGFVIIEEKVQPFDKSAATDVTVLAMAGIGLHEGKKLGFASCKRNFGATEGINVLIEKCKPDGTWTYGVSCIEYTEFDKFGIADRSPSPNSLQTEFPANTNILYVDLNAAELIGLSKDETSLPDMVLNVKKSINFIDHFGIKHGVSGGRLECSMQNIADNLVDSFSSQCFEGVEEKLDTFIVYNHRRKVTSSAKKKKSLLTCPCTRLQMVHYLTLYEMRMIFFHIVISSYLRLKVMINILILDHHISSFFILL